MVGKRDVNSAERQTWLILRIPLRTLKIGEEKRVRITSAKRERLVQLPVSFDKRNAVFIAFNLIKTISPFLPIRLRKPRTRETGTMEEMVYN